jgi:hypothetical protein
MFAVFAVISAVSAVSAMSAVFRQSSANGDGDGENDRKECFHGTKVSLTLARLRLPLVPAMRISNEDRSPVGINRSDPAQVQPDLLNWSAPLLIVVYHLRRRFFNPAAAVSI